MYQHDYRATPKYILVSSLGWSTAAWKKSSFRCKFIINEVFHRTNQCCWGNSGGGLAWGSLLTLFGVLISFPNKVNLVHKTCFIYIFTLVPSLPSSFQTNVNLKAHQPSLFSSNCWERTLVRCTASCLRVSLTVNFRSGDNRCWHYYHLKFQQPSISVPTTRLFNRGKW